VISTRARPITPRASGGGGRLLKIASGIKLYVARAYKIRGSAAARSFDRELAAARHRAYLRRIPRNLACFRSALEHIPRDAARDESDESRCRIPSRVSSLCARTRAELSL